MLKIESLNQLMTKKFDELESSLKERSNLLFHQVRKKGINSFKNIGFPHNKSEDYKYSPTRKLIPPSFDLFKEKPSTWNDIESISIKGLHATHLYIVNGKWNQELSDSSFEDGVEVQLFNLDSFDDSMAEKSKFDKLASNNKDPYILLNSSFLQEAFWINVKKGKMIKKPLLIHFISDTTKAVGISATPRVVVTLEDGAHLQVIEKHDSIGTNVSFTNAVLEAHISHSANLNWTKIQMENETTYQVNNTLVHQMKDSYFSGTTITLGGKVIRNNLNVILDEEHIETNMYGLYLLKENQHLDNHTCVDHRKAHCKSNELYKGIMDDKSTGVFNGKIFVRQEAQKTRAFQSNRNILLNNLATIDTKPQLEIWADDVKCSHGCTIGQLDEAQLFYLRARGLSRDSAKAMLLSAFAIDSLSQIKNKVVKEYVENAISNRLRV